jgi:hypothetical protein
MKTEVYSWRVSARRKSDLEAEAQRLGCSLAEVLEAITEEWLKSRRASRQQEAAELQKLREVVRRSLGTISGANPGRAQNARTLVRQRLKERHASRRSR